MTGSSQKGNPAGVGKRKDPPPLGRKFLNRKVLEHGNVFWGKYGTALPKQPPFGTVRQDSEFNSLIQQTILCSYIYSSAVESIISSFCLSTGRCRALAGPIDLHEH